MSKGWLKVATFGLRGGSVSGTLGKEEVSRFEKVGLNMHEVSNTVQAREGWFKKRCETVAEGVESVWSWFLIP